MALFDAAISSHHSVNFRCRHRTRRRSRVACGFSIGDAHAVAHRDAAETEIFIVYDENASGSRDEALALADERTSLAIGAEDFPLEIVPLSNLSTLGEAAGMIYFTSLLTVEFDDLRRRTSAFSAITASSDPECVRTQACILSVRSRPRVEILFNSEAADQRSVAFKEQFLRLVKSV